MIFAELKELFKKQFNDPTGFNIYIDDNAKKLPTNPLFDLIKSEAIRMKIEKLKKGWS